MTIERAGHLAVSSEVVGKVKFALCIKCKIEFLSVKMEVPCCNCVTENTEANHRALYQEDLECLLCF